LWVYAFAKAYKRNGEVVLNDVSLNDDPDNDGSQGVLLFEVLPRATTNDNALEVFCGDTVIVATINGKVGAYRVMKK
jgi:hypothetical protein